MATALNISVCLLPGGSGSTYWLSPELGLWYGEAVVKLAKLG
jgi:hypothetical protein